MLSLAVGLTAGLVITIPQFRPSGIPVAYVSLLLVFFWYCLRGETIGRSTALILAFWALPAAYAVIHDVVLSSGEALQLAVRNSVTLLLAWIVVAQTRRPDTAAPILVGLGLVMLVDVALGIGQFWAQPWAVVLSLPFASLEVVAGLEADSVIRSWGLHSYPHVYAYTISLWTFVCGVSLVHAKSIGRTTRRFLAACLAAGLVAVVLSAQRSAVWALVPALCAVVLVGSPRLMRVLPSVGLVVVLVVGTALASLSARTDRNPVARLLAGEDSASDSIREQSWVAGLEVLEADPYFGGAFRTYAGDVGVHNGFLGGWAEFGLIWLLGIIVAVLLTCRYFMVSTMSKGCRVAGLLLIGMMLVNAMFHTVMVARNDMVFLVFLGALLGLSRVASRSPPQNLLPRNA